jgi:LacI family transcriptional regulator
MPKPRSPSAKKARSQRVKRVALLLESDMAFDRAIARGVGEYLRDKTGWIILMDPMMKDSMEGLKHWEPDGIITSIHLPNIDAITTLVDVPKIGFGSYSEDQDGHLPFPIVTSNQFAIGAMAARHFISKGMRHFAFCGGDESALWCRQRLAGFQKELQRQDHQCLTFTPEFSAPVRMPEAISALADWLKSLPKPTGMFVFFDGWARWVLDACVLQGIQVPQEVSVVGVDNDRWLCELSQPMLSSVDPNVNNAGYKTAELLDQLMEGSKSVPKILRIDPSRVVARDSSDFLNFTDPEVAFAMRYIEEHACDPITTADVLRATGMSNSTAYRKFMKSIGRSIHAEIQRKQIDRVKELLISTNLSVNAVAAGSGFENVRYLTQVFREMTGKTPTEYRRTQSTPSVV